MCERETDSVRLGAQGKNDDVDDDSVRHDDNVGHHAQGKSYDDDSNDDSVDHGAQGA